MKFQQVSRPYILSGLFCLSSGLTPWLLSGILSRPWSPLASLPPEVDVPLPLGLGFIELPVVGDVPGAAELAAGSPVVEPRPLGTRFVRLHRWRRPAAPLQTKPMRKISL